MSEEKQFISSSVNASSEWLSIRSNEPARSVPNSRADTDVVGTAHVSTSAAEIMTKCSFRMASSLSQQVSP